MKHISSSLLLVLTFSRFTYPFPDWLTTDITMATEATETSCGTLRLSNGIISREFLFEPDFGTVDYYSHEKQSSVLRALNPEAVITLDNREYNISGLEADIPRAYLNRTALFASVKKNPHSFHYAGYQVAHPVAPYKYTPRRGTPKDISWPPKGLRLDVTFIAPSDAPKTHQQVTVVVHYEMYDGIPLMAKWISVHNPTDDKIEVTFNTIEELNVNFQWAQQGYGWMDIGTDRPHNQQVVWGTDPLQHQMPGSFEPRVICKYHQAPTLLLKDALSSFRVHELLHGSRDPERVGLAIKRKFRLLAPQTQETPIFFHMTDSTSSAVRKLVDQMHETGFEMLIYSFKSGFDFESTNETYIEQLTQDVAYANSKGIEVGGHDLIVWDKDGKMPNEWVADTETQYHGACMASGWYDYLLDLYIKVMDRTGMTMVEADGPYPGYVCHSTNHSHHRGLEDSVYMQNELQGKFFRILHERGVFINQPDGYFFDGANKAVLGYSESQFALPRWQDVSISRQGIYDNTYDKSPTIGWMIVPLIDYKAWGGAAGMFEPLSQNLKSYEWSLAQHFGAGVSACYRGYRLYDTDETKEVVKKWVAFYKKYRDILSSDIIHIRRPDMQSIDGFIHVNHRLQNKALAMFFNPTLEEQAMNMTLPLYYTGLQYTAKIAHEENEVVEYHLDRQFNVEIEVKLEALGITWFLVR